MTRSPNMDKFSEVMDILNKALDMNSIKTEDYVASLEAMKTQALCCIADSLLIIAEKKEGDTE